MRVPLSWLAQYAALGEELPDPADVARRLTAAGLEVETFEPAGHDVSGVVIGEVTGIEELTGFRKPIRYCQVTDGDQTREVICGAANFAVGDRVAFAPPGAVLPGGFAIGEKKAYGRMSQGMICSAAELAIGDDHSGILVLPPDAPLGAGFAGYAGLADHVFEISVTPDRGYALSIRGVASELATAYGVAYTDPADDGLPAGVALVSAAVYPASIADPAGCDRFVLREVRGLEPATPTPLWLRVRLARCGMRSVSLAVDITNYLMLELGQPLHAFDHAKLTGPIVVRRARPGERLETLDHVVRELDPDDILITDSSGPISHGGHHGRAGDRDLGFIPRPGDRGGPLLRPWHRPDEPPAPAVQRGVVPVRAGSGPRTAAAGVGQGGCAAGLAGRRPAWSRVAPTPAWTCRRP